MSIEISQPTTPDATLLALRRPAPHFQRAINLQYDLGDAACIAAYVPTPNAGQLDSVQ